MFDAPSFSMVKRTIMIGIPLLLAVVTSLFHATDYLLTNGMDASAGKWIPYLSSIRERWLWLHIVQLPIFVGLAFIVAWMLPAGSRSSAISRVALFCYLTLYPAFDALVGIGSALLLQYRATLPPAEQSILDPAISQLFLNPSTAAFWIAFAATASWSVAAISAGIALWSPAGKRVAIPIIIAGVAMGVDHAPPFGPIAGIALAFGAWQFLKAGQRQPSAGRAVSLVPSPN